MPEILEDRSAVESLLRNTPVIYDVMKRQGVGRIQNKKTVHFCGLVNVSAESATLFLPRNTNRNGLSRQLQSGRLLMKTLSRYGRETIGRSGESHEEGDTANIAALVQDLTIDYLGQGIYAQRQQIRSKQSGKPNWKRTIANSVPIFTKQGVTVYPELKTTRFQDSRSNPLSRIHAAIMREIISANGWWLEGLDRKKTELESFDKPNEPRAFWKSTLLRIMPTLYAARATRLVKMMMQYLDGTSGSRNGEFIAGVEDFEWVWETMLRAVLPNVEHGWNARLPKPAYEDGTGIRRYLKGSMEMDIVLRPDSQKLTILDAKYYGGKGLGSVPGTPDIVKQVMYKQALESVLQQDGTAETVSNGFVLPWDKTQSGKFKRAGLYHKITDFHPLGGDIDIYYVDVLDVMQKYVDGSKYTTLPWLE